MTELNVLINKLKRSIPPIGHLHAYHNNKIWSVGYENVDSLGMYSYNLKQLNKIVHWVNIQRIWGSENMSWVLYTLIFFFNLDHKFCKIFIGKKSR